MTFFRALTRFRAAPSRRAVALRASVCSAAAVLVATAIGQPALGAVGVLGAFAALYGGRGPARDAGIVAIAAVGLTASITIGASTAGHPWLSVAVVAAWSVVVTAACEILGAQPPGKLMFVLAAGVGTGLPTGRISLYAAAVAATGVAAIVITALDQGRRGSTATRSLYQWRPISLLRSYVPRTAWRTGLGVALAGSGALAADLGRPYWAMTAATAVLSRGTYAGIVTERALLRMSGAAVGCAVAALVLWTDPYGAATALLLGASIVLVEIFVARNYAVAMVFAAPTSALMAEAAGTRPPLIATTAFLIADTVVGCLAAMIAGQFVSRRWVARQRFYAITGILRAAEAVLTDPTTVDELHRARERAAMIADRTAAERRGVRASAARWDRIAAETDRVAEDVLDFVATPAPAATERASTEIRRLTADAHRILAA